MHSIFAKITLLSEGNLHVLLDTGEECQGGVEEAAKFLFSRNVLPSQITMPDWREGDVAPTSGQKIGILSALRRIALNPSDERTVPD